MKATLAAMIVIAGATSSAHAQESRLRFSDDWTRVHPASYVAMGTAFGGSLFFDYLFNPGPEALVRGPQFLDGPIRARLRAPDHEVRERASSVSDVVLAGLLLWPFIDSIVVAGFVDQNSDVFWQLSMIAAEAYAFDTLFNTLAKQLVARERPHGDFCTEEMREENPHRCGTRGRLRSFYSGHSSAAFNSAGVTCMAHAHLPLYVEEGLDWFACGAAVLSATVVAVMRVIADRHYATDVLIGAAVGLASGLLLPYLLHFGWDPTNDDEMRPSVMGVSSAPAMLRWQGSF